VRRGRILGLAEIRVIHFDQETAFAVLRVANNVLVVLDHARRDARLLQYPHGLMRSESRGPAGQRRSQRIPVRRGRRGRRRGQVVPPQQPGQGAPVRAVRHLDGQPPVVTPAGHHH
jgi:hypothetical protein